MVSRAELLAKLVELQAQLNAVPLECEGCSAPIAAGEVCVYCGRVQESASLPDEPPDIRKTNASDDQCPMCQQIHPKDAYTPITCRCLYCGKIGPVAMSTFDPILGQGIVCTECCRGAGPRDLGQMGAEALARDSGKLPWQ